MPRHLLYHCLLLFFLIQFYYSISPTLLLSLTFSQLLYRLLTKMRPWKQKRVFLFSHPRTASNLFIRLLSDQPEWAISDYLFFDSFQYTRSAFDGAALEDVPKAARAEHEDLVEKGRHQLEEFIGSAKEQVTIVLRFREELDANVTNSKNMSFTKITHFSLRQWSQHMESKPCQVTRRSSQTS